MTTSTRPLMASNNRLRPIAIFLFGILILAAVIEEYRNSSISSGTLFCSDFGVSIRQVYHNVTRSPSNIRRRKAYIVLVDNRDLATKKSYGYYTFAMWQMYTSLVPDDTCSFTIQRHCV
jgi:hypothetical protein